MTALCRHVKKERRGGPFAPLRLALMSASIFILRMHEKEGFRRNPARSFRHPQETTTLSEAMTGLMTDTALLRLLRQTDLFGALDEADLPACAEAFRKVSFEAGRVLFMTGDPGDRAYLIAEGMVRLALATASGRELNVRMAGAGDLIGEIAVLDRGPRTADAVAISPVTAYSITATSLSALFEERPRLASAVIAHLCKRLRATTNQMEGIALHRIEFRLARFLIERLQDAPQAGQGRRQPLELGYSQGELARLIGASRPKLNVALGLLEKTGAIKRTADRLFCDRETLERLVETQDD